MQPEELECRCP